MIALLCALLSLRTSLVPWVLGCFEKNKANQQKLAMRKAKVKRAGQLSNFKIKEPDAQAEIREMAELNAHDQFFDSGSFVYGLRGSVGRSLPIYSSRHSRQ